MSFSSSQDYLNQFNQNTQKMFEPWTKLNQAFLKNAEMMTDFSLNTIKTYSEMGLENMRHVAEIDSPESAKEFNSKQAEMLNSMSQQMLADAQKMTELGNLMQNEVMQVMNNVYSQTNDQMQANMQKTADHATKTANEFAANMNNMAEKATEQASNAMKNATGAMKNATGANSSSAKSSASDSSSSADKSSSMNSKSFSDSKKS